MSVAVETGGESTVAGREHDPGPFPGSDLPSNVCVHSGQPTSTYSVTRRTATVPVSSTIRNYSLLQAFQSLVYIIVIALFIITFTVQPFRIPSESMEPTLLVGDFLLVNKEASSGQTTDVFAHTNLIQRGDLIVFHYPVKPSLHLVKRVVGLPGDRLRLRDGRVYIDGRAISEPYAVFRPSSPDGYRDDFPHIASADPGVDSRWWIQMHSLVSHGELTIPPDSYFVLGDNRNDSEDSRYWGFVPRAAIVGKPFLIYFSLRSLDNTPNQIPSVVGGRHEAPAPLGSLVDFARWDRALRIIY